MKIALKLTCWIAVLVSFLDPELAIAKQLQLNTALGYPTMLTGDSAQKTNYLRIAMTGFDIPAEKDRQPVNVAIVIDKSGSMQGEKITQARRAAIEAIARLRETDIVSIIAYDSEVSVVVPATRASDREYIRSRISGIQAGGDTALFAGVSKGAAEVRKFLDEKRVNRVILLSDGLANVGPSTPGELEELGRSLIKEGISVSTMGLGLGYNEDLMTQLALASSGNHVFIENAENLVQVFQNEFDDVLSVVAQQLQIKVKLAEGIRAVKVLNYPAEVSGQLISIDVGQLYSNQLRYFVVEIEVPLRAAGQRTPIGDVTLDYINMLTENHEQLASKLEVRFSSSQAEVDEAIEREVLSDCILQIANENNRRATRLRDLNQVEEAREVLHSNSDFLRTYGDRLASPALVDLEAQNRKQAENLEGVNWNENRKLMRAMQIQSATQQSYQGDGSKIPKP
ncbi:MAG: VWA domain-containing protein [Planctomycetales bacterium]|nr:VWA domain-containing protein [Planctomycetales bacterium]